MGGVWGLLTHFSTIVPASISDKTPNSKCSGGGGKGGEVVDLLPKNDKKHFSWGGRVVCSSVI